MLRSVLKSRLMRVFILALTLLAAYTSFAQRITVEFDQAADFKKYHTFAIRGGH
jgi:hypothetical protein